MHKRFGLFSRNLFAQQCTHNWAVRNVFPHHFPCLLLIERAAFQKICNAYAKLINSILPVLALRVCRNKHCACLVHINIPSPCSPSSKLPFCMRCCKYPCKGQRAFIRHPAIPKRLAPANFKKCINISIFQFCKQRYLCNPCRRLASNYPCGNIRVAHLAHCIIPIRVFHNPSIYKIQPVPICAGSPVPIRPSSPNIPPAFLAICGLVFFPRNIFPPYPSDYLRDSARESRQRVALQPRCNCISRKQKRNPCSKKSLHPCSLQCLQPACLQRIRWGTCTYSNCWR